MANANKNIKVKTKDNKVIELKQQGNVAFQLLLKLQSTNQNIDLGQIMKYQLTPVPSCLGSSDGCIGKTNKAKGMQYILSDVPNENPPDPHKTLLVIDGNAVFLSMTDIPGTFEKYLKRY